ncbi:MAG: sulfatase [Acidobacteriota bacterium]
MASFRAGPAAQFLAAGAMAGLVAASFGCAAAPPGPPPGAPRGIVLVSIDTLRADHLGCYGYRRPTSPFLDQMARRGVLFENAVSSAPWTLPSHASLLTGLYPSAHRAIEGHQAVAPGVRLAAEWLRQAGYATGGVVASWFVSRRYGFDRGFDHFEDFGQSAATNTRQKIAARQVVDDAAAWLRTVDGQPFFLFLHFYDPHFNYDPPDGHALFDTGYQGPRPRYRKYAYYLEHPLPPALLADEVARYDGEIHYVDAQLRRLYGILEKTGRAADTLLLVTADHGEEFFEHGSWGHAHTLHQELMRVPLLVAGPGVAGGRRIPFQVRQVDLLPTLLEAVGAARPAGLHGRSFLSWLRDPAAPPGEGRPALMETSRFDTNLLGLRRGGWTFIEDLARGQERLFDREADPGEAHDLSRAEPERLAGLRDAARAAAVAVLPDRWFLRWESAGASPLEGKVETSGRFLLVRTRGENSRAALAGQGRVVEYHLEAGGELELALMPVDAEVRVVAPAPGGRPVRLAVGAAGRLASGPELRASARDAARLLGRPAAAPPALAVWLEQQGGGGRSVTLTEDEIRRLESLGYVMR